MIYLDSTSRTLEIDLAGSVSATEMNVVACYTDLNKEGLPTHGGTQLSLSTGTTDATILSAPKQNFVRRLEYLSIHNRDTAPATITVKIDDATVEKFIFQQVVPSLRTICYEHGNGWYMI